MLTFFAMIVSIRPRTRLAVSRFSTQIGLSRSWTWLGLISGMVSLPIFSDDGHWSQCFSLQVDQLERM